MVGASKLSDVSTHVFELREQDEMAAFGDTMLHLAGSS